MGSNETEHLKTLEEVLQHLHYHGIKVCLDEFI